MPSFSEDKDAYLHINPARSGCGRKFACSRRQLACYVRWQILFNEILPSELRFMNDPVKTATIKTVITKALAYTVKKKWWL